MPSTIICMKYCCCHLWIRKMLKSCSRDSTFLQRGIDQSCSFRGDIWLGGKRKAGGRSLASSSGDMNRRLMEANLPARGLGSQQRRGSDGWVGDNLEATVRRWLDDWDWRSPGRKNVFVSMFFVSQILQTVFWSSKKLKNLRLKLW